MRLRVKEKPRQLKIGKVRFIVNKKDEDELNPMKRSKKKGDEIWGQMKHYFAPVRLNKRQKKKRLKLGDE